MNELIQFILNLDDPTDPIGKSIILWIKIFFGIGVINYVLHILWIWSWEKLNLSNVQNYIRANHGLGDTSPELLERLRNAKVSKLSIIYKRIHDLVQIKQKSGQITQDALADIHAGQASRKAGLSNYILGILIILGLIGTLRGLITAIVEVQPLLQDIQDIDQFPMISEALRETLAGMNTAFVTTLAGLGASFGLGFFGWLFNWLNSAFLTHFERFVSTEIIPHFTQTPEASIASAVEQLTKCADTLELATQENVQAMHQAIQLLTDTSWGGHLEQQYILADNFGRTAESLLGSLGKISEHQVLIKTTVEKFDGLTEQSMSQIGEYQKALRQGLEDSVPKLEEESEALKTTIAEYRTSQATFIDDLASALQKQLQPVTKNQEEIVQTLNKTAGHLSESLTKISEYQTHITSAVEGFNEATMESMSQITEYQDVLRQGLEDAIPKLTAESQTLKTTIGEYQDSQSKFVDELSGTLQGHLQSVTENQQKMVDMLTDELSNTLDPFNESNAQLVTQIKEYQGTVQRGLENSLSQFAAESQTLKTAIDEYQNSQSRFIDELSGTLQGHLQSVTENQQEMVHMLTDELSNTLDPFNEVNTRLASQIREYQSTMQRGLENSLSQFAAESQALKTAIDEYRDSQSTFVDELSDALQAKLRPITESQEGMVRVLTGLSDELQIRSVLETQNQVFGRIEDQLNGYGERVDQQNELIQALVANVQMFLQRPSGGENRTMGEDSSQQIPTQLLNQISLKLEALNDTMRRPGIYRWGSEIRRWFGGSR